MEEDRTLKQNNAIHLYCELVARELRSRGQTMQDVIKLIHKLEITPTKNSVKDILWLPLQEKLFATDSTTKLKKKEQIDMIYDGINKFTSLHFEFSVPFPNIEEKNGIIDK